MIERSAALRVARLAGGVLEKSKALDRVANGYTRIDPVGIAEAEGIHVLARPLDKLLGAFLREDQVGILLNTLRPSGMFHMTCAHELGHYFLGHGTTADDRIDYEADASSFELEADQFAYALMSPLWLITHVLRVQRWGWGMLTNPLTVYQLSLRLGLSYAGTVWSLARHKKLDSATARRLAKIRPADIKAALAPQGTFREAATDVWQVGPRDKDHILEPRLSDQIIMDLPSHAAAGYLWSVDEAAAAGYALKPITIDSSAERSAAEADLPVGSASTARYELAFDGTKPAAAAQAPIRAPQALEPNGATSVVEVPLAERQPWLRASTPLPTAFSLRTKFESSPIGLSAAGRERRLKQALEE